MLKKTSQEILNQIEPLYLEGKLDKEIASVLAIKSGVVSKYLRDRGLESNYRKKLLSSDGTKAICTICNQSKLLEEFQYGRKGTDKEYKFSYCNTCRGNKIKQRLSSDISSYLRGRLHKFKKKDPNCNLDLEYLIWLYKTQKGKCFYTDYDMIFQQSKGLCRNSLSLDKVVPELGYTIGNVVFCVHKANTIKSDLTLEELKCWIPAWYQKLKDTNFVTTLQ